MALSHPETAESLHRYGRVSNNEQASVSEQSDGSKWVHEIKSYYARDGQTNYFTGDFVCADSAVDNNIVGQISSFVQDIEYDITYAKVKLFQRRMCINELTLRSLICLEREEMWNICQLSLVQLQVNECTFYKSDEEHLIPLTETEKEKIIQCSRLESRSLPIYTLPFNLFMDDTSANKSKKWKPLHCLQFQLSGLPKKVKQSPQNVKFVAASTEVPILEMASAVISDIKNSESGILTFDAKKKEKATIIPTLALCICDFNMMAEASNHLGANTKKFCPRCYADRETCIWKGSERIPEETRRLLNHLSVNNRKEIRQNHGLKASANPLWNIINPHRDIPVGILHWLYLGLGKHLLKALIEELTEAKQEQLSLLIESCDQTAFQYKVSSDTIRYIDSRQGKDIKTYLQIAPFHFSIVGADAIKVHLLSQLSEISKILTCQSQFSETFLGNLREKINGYLEGVFIHFSHLKQKVKTHLSVHVVDDIFAHGPLDCYKEDAFEKMHGRVRDQLFAQNQHARSRDTANAFAEMEMLQHVLTGGYFPVGEKWLQASKQVQDAAKSRCLLQFLGMPIPDNYTNVCRNLRKAMDRQNGSLMREIIDHQDVQLLSTVYQNEEIDFQHARRSFFSSLKAQSGELVNSGTPVSFASGGNMEDVGVFLEGWKVWASNGVNVQVAKIRKVEKTCDSHLSSDMNIERVKLSNHSILIQCSRVKHIVCMVHDCLSERCRVKDGLRDVCVEQEKTKVNKKFWKHVGNTIYYLNRFSFANKKDQYFD